VVDDLAGSPARLLEDCDVVYHLAAEPGVRSSWGRRFQRFLHHNVEATQRLLEAAREAPGTRVVYASSSSVYGESERLPTPEHAPPQPRSPYGVTKLAAEQLCRVYHANHGVDAVVLRFFTVYGPRQRPDMAFRRFCEAAARGAPIQLFGDGRQSRDFTYVGDIVDATIAAMARGTAGGVYNIGGGSEISLLDSLALCERVAERTLRVEHVAAATGDARRTIADFGKAAVELGWSPKTTLEQGLRAQAGEALTPEPAETPAQDLALAESA
jgi:UDP-glucuronate 4-epimerase